MSQPHPHVRLGSLIDSSNPSPSFAPGAIRSPIAFTASASVADPLFELTWSTLDALVSASPPES